MKILDIMPRVPYPPDDGGKIVLYNTYKFLSGLGCKIDLLTFAPEMPDINITEKLNEFGKSEIIIKNTKNSIGNMIKYTLKNQPIYIYKYTDSNVFRKIDELFAENKYDVVHCEHSATALLGLYLKRKYGVILGHRMHNIEWKIWERFTNELPAFSFKKIFVNQQAKLLKKFENDFYSTADINFSITDNDRQFALNHSKNSNIVNASIGVEPKRWVVTDCKRNPYELIIATTYDWVHNVNGLKWFISCVLPIIQREIPEVKLTLLGKNVPNCFKRHSNPAINPIGYVKSVSGHLNNASVYIAPLFVGSGIRVKILEAMAMELPVVATKISAEGIKSPDELTDNGLFVSDNPDLQAEHIIKLLKNNQYRDSEGIKARTYVFNNFDWKSNIQIMINNYEDLINDKKNRTIN